MQEVVGLSDDLLHRGGRATLFFSQFITCPTHLQPAPTLLQTGPYEPCPGVWRLDMAGVGMAGVTKV